MANVAYGSYSIYVATRKRRDVRLVQALAVANMGWLIVMLSIVYSWRDAITSTGIVIVLGEGIYVAAPGFTEWQWRATLAKPRRNIAA